MKHNIACPLHMYDRRYEVINTRAFWGWVQGIVMKESVIASQGSKGMIALRLVE